MNYPLFNSPPYFCLLAGRMAFPVHLMPIFIAKNRVSAPGKKTRQKKIFI